MTRHVTLERAFPGHIHQPAGTRFAPGHRTRAAMRARLLVASGLATVLLLLGVMLWLDNADWKKLLLFAGIVLVAAAGPVDAAQGQTARRAPAGRRFGRSPPPAS